MTLRAPDRPRLAYVVTHAHSAHLLVPGQLAFLRRQGFDVTVVCSPGEGLEAAARREEVAALPLPLCRTMRPGHDALALVRLYRLLRSLHPAIVTASTPKAGLLGMLAAWMAGIPVRVYTLRGLRLETACGAERAVLTLAERLAQNS
jgi:hypothetical protein